MKRNLLERELHRTSQRHVLEIYTRAVAFLCIRHEVSLVSRNAELGCSKKAALSIAGFMLALQNSGDSRESCFPGLSLKVACLNARPLWSSGCGSVMGWAMAAEAIGFLEGGVSSSLALEQANWPQFIIYSMLSLPCVVMLNISPPYLCMNSARLPGSFVRRQERPSCFECCWGLQNMKEHKARFVRGW